MSQNNTTAADSNIPPPGFNDWKFALHPYLEQEITFYKRQLSLGAMDPPAMPNYRAKAWNLWHMVFVVGFYAFCQDIWHTNMNPGKAIRREVNREEAEIMWCIHLVGIFKTWDPLRVSRKKDLDSAIAVKRKVLQHGILQIYGSKRGDLDQFWTTKKLGCPQITIDHFTATSADDFHTLIAFGEKWGAPAKKYKDLTPDELKGEFAAYLLDNGISGVDENGGVEENGGASEVLELVGARAE